jgi:hypothetical protein
VLEDAPTTDALIAMLARRWRDAEELAAIADKLGIPADVEARLEAMRSAHPRTGEKGEP